jgi:predicted O-methyltransferase YrrM
MQTVRQLIIDRLWRGHDPFAAFPSSLYMHDSRGWNSDHVYLHEAIDQLRPQLVVEVGVWKGGSVLTMARRMRDLGQNGIVLAVDTWLGSSEHWLAPEFLQDLSPQFGYPQLYHKFMNNVLTEQLQDYVVPLPLDSGNAFEVLRRLGLRASVAHVDAAHDYLAVTLDLERWWSLLAPGGMLIADDYDATRQVWPEVGRAVDDFRARVPHTGFAALPYKCRFSKPAG